MFPFQLLTNYETLRTIVDKPNLNSGLVNKCKAARSKGFATEFEGLVVKFSGMASGLAKRRNMQAGLRTLQEENIPLDIVCVQLLHLAQEQSKSAKVAKPAGSLAVSDAVPLGDMS
jgi:hypothetical protein